MRGMSRVPLRDLAIAGLLLLLAGCDSETPSAPPSNPASRRVHADSEQEGVSPAGAQDRKVPMLQQVSIEILGPVSSLKGHQWPRGYDALREAPNQPLQQILLDRPHELVIRLPSGRTIRHISKATFFNHERGTVIRASLMPHPGLLRYQDAITLLEEILKRWDATPDPNSQRLLDTWKSEGDRKPWITAQRQGGAPFRGETRAAISFAIRPSWEKDGWFVVVDVAATLEEARRLWGGNAAATRPATSEPKQY